jgi:uncharacterized protein (DUF488 family)
MSDTPVRKPRLFTIGHSDRTLAQFLGILERSSVRLVADIRSNPASARYPHFERAALSGELGKRGLVYRWFRDLGGRQSASPDEDDHTALKEVGFRRYAAHMNTGRFHASAQDLLGLAASTIMVVMCAERDFHQCHRQFLADKLLVMGARVVHILDAETAIEHTPHPDLVVEGHNLLYRKKQLELLR